MSPEEPHTKDFRIVEASTDEDIQTERMLFEEYAAWSTSIYRSRISAKSLRGCPVTTHPRMAVYCQCRAEARQQDALLYGDWTSAPGR
jgi:hypothetical protein